MERLKAGIRGKWEGFLDGVADIIRSPYSQYSEIEAGGMPPARRRPVSPEFSPRELDVADRRLLKELLFISLVGGGMLGGLLGTIKIAEAAGGIKHPLKVAFVAGMPIYGMIAGAISAHLIEKRFLEGEEENSPID